MINIFAKSRKGLTFIELLLVVSIIAIVGTAGVLSFRSGRTTWGSSDKQTQVIQSAVVGMEKVSRELNNSPGLTSISNNEIRFKVLRDKNNVGNYIEWFARLKRVGNDLKYLEKSTNAALDNDNDLNTLASPVTSLSFIYLMADGVTQTTVPDEVKSVKINMTTEDGGVTIPLVNQVYIRADNTTAGLLDFEDGDTGDTTPPPPGTNPDPGSLGNGIDGWTADDYCIYGQTGVNVSNSSKIYGNVGTHGSSYNSQNSVEVHGYLVVYGTLNMSNSGSLAGDSIAAAYTPSYSVNFANSARAAANLWTFGKVTMSNSSRINGTVYQPNTLTAPTITCNNSSGYTAKELKAPTDMAFLLTLFPTLPEKEPGTSFNWNTSNQNVWNTTTSLSGTNYGDIGVSGSSVLTLAPTNARNLDISNSSRVNMTSGNYYFNKINICNSSKIRINFTTNSSGQVQPIRIFMKDRFDLSNSSSFVFYKNGSEWSDQYEAARYIYVEARNGLTCSNSVQWKGFIYVPNGDINFSNSTSLVGAAICSGTVNLANSVEATYVAPIYNTTTQLLRSSFHPAP